jgi:hypothetical protein
MRGKFSLLFLAFAVLLAVPAIAYAADELIADGDVINPGNNLTRNLGTVNPGQPAAPSPVTWSLDCMGNNHFNAGETADLNVTATSIKDANGITPSTGNVNAQPLSNITGPTTVDGTPYPQDGNNACPTTNPVIGVSNVAIVAPKKAGNYTVTVTYRLSRDSGATAATTTAPNELALAQDGTGGAAVDDAITLTYTLTVPNVSPQINAFNGDTTATEGNTKPYSINASDANEDALTYGLTKASGTANVNISNLGSGNFNVNFLTAGSVTLQASVSDVTNPAVTQNKTVTVASADSTPPVITPNVTPAAPNGNGWYKDDVSVSWTVSDAQSPITSKSADCDTTTNITADTTASGQTVTCSATSTGGTDTKSVTIKLDKTAPNNFQFVGGINDGDSFPFGSVPDEPTCTADGAVSGLASPCQVTGYGTAVGPHTLTATATDNAGNEGTSEISYTVTKATQEITGFDPIADKTYGDPDFDVSAQGGGSGEPVTFTATGDCTVDGATVSITGAGSCTVTAHQDGNANYEAAKDVSQSFAIDKADQTITFGPLADKTYGDPDFDVNPTASSGLLVDLAATGDCTVSGNTVTITGAGNCTIKASQGGDANHYPAQDVSRSFAIARAPITIKADNASREYGEPNPSFTGSIVSGLKNNDALSVTASSSATAASGVGTYDIVPELSGAKASNYDVTAQNGTLTVTAAPLSAEANSASRKYGEANPAFTGTLTGVKNNDAITASYSSSATAASDVGTYDIVPAIDATASVLANYQTPVLTKGTLTVNKADAIEAKANNASREYGEANPAFTGTLTGVKNSDAITASYSSAATQASDWGTYSIVTSLNDPNGKLSNYEAPVLTNGTLTVTKAPLTIKADNASRLYGEANPTFTGSIVNAASTVKNNDALSVTASSSATSSSLPGTYPIVPALGGAKAGNYNVTAQNGTLTIGAWTLKGFHSPVDMDTATSTALNTVKAGSTVPLKFNVLKGATEMTSTTAIKGFSTKAVPCPTSNFLADEIEFLTTGSTTLRYDGTAGAGGQFIQNWQTPKKVGCHDVTMETQDGSKLVAHFQLR